MKLLTEILGMSLLVWDELTSYLQSSTGCGVQGAGGHNSGSGLLEQKESVFHAQFTLRDFQTGFHENPDTVPPNPYIVP